MKPLLLLLSLLLARPAFAADSPPPEDWPETDEPSQKAARTLAPTSRAFSLYAGIPLLIAGGSFALTAGPLRWTGAPVPAQTAFRVAGLSLLAGADGALLVGHAAARAGRGFAGGAWDDRIGSLIAGAVLLGGGYALTVGGLTDGALALPPLSVSLVAGGVAASAVGAVILIQDTLATAAEIDRRLPPAVALRADPGIRFAGAWIAPGDGGLQGGFALRFR
jgi:hypothetical protein